MLISLFVCGMAMAGAVVGDATHEDLKNGNFKSGLTNWTTRGSVTLNAPSQSVELKSSDAAIEQTVSEPGSRILTVSATAANQPTYPAEVRIQCLDSQDHVLLELNQAFGTKPATGIYFKTHPFTNQLRVVVQRNSDREATVQITEVKIVDEDQPRTTHAPEADLEAYMAPIWHATTVVDESALMFSHSGGQASGKLLFEPTEVLSVTDSTRKVKFVVNQDFSFSKNVITRLPGSKMPMVSDTEIPKGLFPWLNLAGKHVLVTYRHRDKWEGPVSTYAGRSFPGTIAKLKAHVPVTVVAYGDSITLGINVSGFRGESPFMPTWAELFTTKLSKVYGGKPPQLFNTALGGMTAEWGRDNAASLVSSLNPDLVLIAFGMNDFWSFTPEQFRNNIADTIATVRKTHPKCEFILIASMKFDPEYTTDPQYTDKLPAFADELRSLTGPGVSLLDMTKMSDALYAAKSSKDLGTDPMHPDDFLARWYAQSLVAMLDPFEKPSRAANLRRSPKTFFVDPTGNDSNDGTTAAHPWKSVDRINREELVPGDHVQLAPGATFAGSLRLTDRDEGTPAQPIVIGSVGKRATIISPDGPAISVARGGIEIRNLDLRGGALAKKEHHDGLLLSAQGDRKQRFIRIHDVSISGFGGDGLAIHAPQESAFGFENVVISHVSATGNFGTGILCDDGIAYLKKGYAHSDFTITDCDTSANFSGSGLILCGVDRAIVEYCRSDNNHGLGGGVAMWAWCANHVTFRYCIASGTRTNDGGDGGGFDLDGGCKNCVVEHCVSYRNDGPGYMHCDFPSAPPTIDNSIRDCVSFNDGRKPKGDSLGFGFVTWGSGLDDCVVERNLAVVTENDPKKRDFGVFFVNLITGSKAAGDVLHVKHCVARDNLVAMSGTGVALVRSEMPRTTSDDVQYRANRLDSSLIPKIIDDGHYFSNSPGWQIVRGVDSGLFAKIARSAKANRDAYAVLRPRDLPQFFQNGFAF